MNEDKFLEELVQTLDELVADPIPAIAAVVLVMLLVNSVAVSPLLS